MADFEKALTRVLRWEGGWYDGKKYAGDPNPTNYGITLSTFRTYYGATRTAADLRAVTREQVRAIYRDLFWSRIQGDRIASQSVAELLFDFAVNSGVRTAVRKLQAVLGTYQDGVMGNITLGKINAYEPQKSLFELLKEQRRLYYNAIVAKTPAKRVFLNGWLNRLNSYKFEG